MQIKKTKREMRTVENKVKYRKSFAASRPFCVEHGSSLGLSDVDAVAGPPDMSAVAGPLDMDAVAGPLDIGAVA